MGCGGRFPWKDALNQHVIVAKMWKNRVSRVGEGRYAGYMRKLRRDRMTDRCRPPERPGRQGSVETGVRPEWAVNSGRKLIAWVVLTAYSLVLVYRAVVSGYGGGVPLWELQDSGQLIRWAAGIVLGGLCDFAYFIPVGFIAMMIFGGGSGRLVRFGKSVRALALCAGVAVVVRGFAVGWSWYLGVVVGLLLPLAGCVFGIWAGSTWLRGRRARLWFFPKLGVLVFLAALGAVVIIRLSMEQTPLPFKAAEVTSAEKRRLVRLIRSKSPRSLRDDQTQTLRLTDHDINVLLSWGLSLGSPDRKANIGLGRDYGLFSASVGVKFGGGRSRYLNLEMAGNSEVEGGKVRVDIYHCRLGSLSLPRSLVR